MRLPLSKKDSVIGFIWSTIFITIICTLIFMLYIVFVGYRLASNCIDNEEYYTTVVEIKSTLRTCDMSIQNYLSTNNRAFLTEHNNGVKAISSRLERLGGNTASSNVLSLLRSIGDAFYSYQSSSNYAAFYQSQNQPLSSVQSLRSSQRISEYLQRYCDDLMLYKQEDTYTYYAFHNRQQMLLLWSAVLVSIALIICTALIFSYLKKAIARPLRQLCDASEHVAQGDMAVRVSEDYEEKMLATVCTSFNSMTVSLKKTMDDLVEKADVEKRLADEQLKNNEYVRLFEQADFMALQSQANPHFLFNTLNSVSCTIALGKYDEALHMLDALSDLLRYNLQPAVVPARLCDEIEIVRQYIAIQQYRFNERINAVFSIDDNVSTDIAVPRFTLQPIVENAVIHGLEPKPDGGVITLRVSRRDDSLCIEIEDNGIGIAPDKLSALLDGTFKSKYQGHTNAIGISNTAKRIRAYAKRQDAFIMVSTVDKGTAVTILLPLIDQA